MQGKGGIADAFLPPLNSLDSSSLAKKRRRRDFLSWRRKKERRGRYYKGEGGDPGRNTSCPKHPSDWERKGDGFFPVCGNLIKEKGSSIASYFS